MDALLAFIFSAFPGAVLGLMLVSCHIRKYGGEETDKLKINSCLIFFGSIPTTLFLYSSFKLLFGKYRSTDISISFELFTGMLSSHIYLNIASKKQNVIKRYGLLINRLYQSYG